MEKRDSFSFRPDPRDVVDELNSRPAAALEGAIQIVDGEADVMQARSSLRHEAADRRIGVRRFQQLHERASGVETRYARAIRVIQLDLVETKDVTKKRQIGSQCLYGNADVGDPDSARGCWGH